MIFKVDVDLIPRTAWGQNLRNGKVIRSSEWQQISKKVREDAGYKCAVCGEYHPEPYGTEAHEIWEWDSATGTQKLKDIICICDTCHLMIHPGFCKKFYPERLREVTYRFMKLNEMTVEEFNQYQTLASLLHMVRSKQEWKLEDDLAAKVRKKYLNTIIF